MKKQLEMSEKLLCAFVKNQSPDLEGGSNMNNMMQMMNTITDTRNKDMQNKIFIENIRQNQNMLSLNMGSLVGGVIDHNHLEFDYNGSPQTMSYKFPKDATSLTLSIVNKGGIPVFNAELNPYETEFIWDGFMQNEKVIEDYQKTVEAGHFPISKGHLLSEEDQVIRTHILNIMCRYETDWSDPALQSEVFENIPELPF